MTDTPAARQTHSPEHDATGHSHRQSDHDHDHDHQRDDHQHGDHRHGAGTDAEALTGAAYWDSRYGESDRMWSGEPNTALVRETADLTPGRALDLGCGEGADSVWLARRGWQVTGTDISSVAVERATRHAVEAGVADQTAFVQADLGSDGVPEGPFDLVSAHFLHSPNEDLPREEILRRAAEVVAPGGVLLVVSHSAFPAWAENPHPELHFPTPEEVLQSLQLPETGWETLVCEDYERPATRPDGSPGHRADNTVMVRRSAG